MTAVSRTALGAAFVAVLGVLMLRCADPPGSDPDLGAGGTLSNGTGGIGTQGSGGSPGAGGTITASSGGSCPEPDLDVVAEVVDRTVLADQQAPPATGGMIADGVYDVTTAVYYGDIDLGTLEGGFRQTMRFREGHVDMARVSAHQPEGSYSTYSITSDGNLLQLEAVCPPDIAGYQDSWAYSAFPDRIESYAEYTTATAVLTYTKRP